MNDRLKFRGMTLGGEWVYGNLAIINEKIKSCGMTVDAGYYISNKVGMPFAYPVRPETLGQCTGLKDKNGKLIYEGDIVKAFGFKDYYKLVCRFRDSSFCLDHIDGSPYNFAHSVSPVEIIGNIHENADLFKTENEE